MALARRHATKPYKGVRTGAFVAPVKLKEFERRYGRSITASTFGYTPKGIYQIFRANKCSAALEELAEQLLDRYGAIRTGDLELRPEGMPLLTRADVVRPDPLLKTLVAEFPDTPLGSAFKAAYDAAQAREAAAEAASKAPKPRLVAGADVLAVLAPPAPEASSELAQEAPPPPSPATWPKGKTMEARRAREPLRQEVYRLLDAGLSVLDVAARLGISPQRVGSLMQRRTPGEPPPAAPAAPPQAAPAAPPQAAPAEPAPATVTLTLPLPLAGPVDAWPQQRAVPVKRLLTLVRDMVDVLLELAVDERPSQEPRR